MGIWNGPEGIKFKTFEKELRRCVLSRCLVRQNRPNWNISEKSLVNVTGDREIYKYESGNNS